MTHLHVCSYFAASWMCFSSAQWPLASNFSSSVTRKSDSKNFSQLEIICWIPWITQIQGTLQFFSGHSLKACLCPHAPNLASTLGVQQCHPPVLKIIATPGISSTLYSQLSIAALKRPRASVLRGGSRIFLRRGCSTKGWRN